MTRDPAPETSLPYLPARPPLSLRIAAFGVHVFTACGAALALLALTAAVQADWRAMFLWLGLALLVDGCDGPLARWLDVKGVLPRWSGDALDFVVDFLTYVFVPAYALMTSGLLLPPLAVPLGLAVVVTGALYFADRDMKLTGDYFRGFPVLWNAAAFYLFVLKPSPTVSTLCVIVLIALTFAPFRFIHPVRVRQWRVVNFVALTLWSVLCGLAVWQNLDVDAWVKIGLGLTGLYFCLMGILAPTQDPENV